MRNSQSKPSRTAPIPKISASTMRTIKITMRHQYPTRLGPKHSDTPMSRTRAHGV